MSRVRARGRVCDACGSTTDLHHAWCLEESAQTDRAQSVSIMQAMLSVVALYLVLALGVGLVIIWSAGHPSEDIAFVVSMLLLMAYVLYGVVSP